MIYSPCRSYQDMLRFLLVLTLFPAGFPAGAAPLGAGSPGPQAELSKEVKATLERLLPEAEKLGFQVEEEPSFFAPDTLYEYINGASEAFLDFGFQALIQQVYQSGQCEVTVDIYDMGDSLDGFGIYSAERSPDYDFVPVGTEGYQAAYILNFVQGRYYVKLSAFSEGIATAPVLAGFGRSLSNRIPEKKELPRQFSLLPKAQRIPHSERYLRRSPLGHEFLSPAFQVSYKTAGQEYTVMIAVAGGSLEANEKADRLRAHLDRNGEIETLPGWPTGVFKSSNRYEGTLIAGKSGAFLIVLINPPPEARHIFEELVSCLSQWR